MRFKTPPIGQTVIFNGKLDYVAQVRIGDEQFVLLWGVSNIRHVPGKDTWEDYLTMPV